MLRRKKRDVLDLPDKIYERRDVFLEGEQLEVYNAVKEELLDELSKIKDWSLSNPLAKMIRLAQITAHLGFYDETSNVSAKIDALQEVLEELEGQMDRGVVVWSRFNFCVQAITKALEKRYRVRGFFGEDSVTGNRMSLEERQEVLDSFKRGDLDVVVVNPKAGGEGVEFTPADAEIFFDRTFSRLEMQQAEDRCHRPGMADRLLIIDLVAYKTIDELTYDLLRTKIAIASALLGELETVRALGKEKVLRYF
ncbi:MAG: C-terminal helicase domain-containing protein, partial [Candidatus Methanomethyliaceae archaeon]